MDDLEKLKKDENMKRSKSPSARLRLTNNNRRRVMLKRVHQKVLARRQQFLQQEMFNNIAEAC